MALLRCNAAVVRPFVGPFATLFAVVIAMLLAILNVSCANVSALTARGVSTANTSEISGVSWYARQGVGQLELLFGARSIRRILDDKQTPPDVRHRLTLVLAARQFAKEQLGLTVKAQFRKVTFLDAPAVVYVVTAAPRTSLEPKTWNYPVVGALPYRGFFSLEQAEAFADALASENDVDVRPVSAYSMLGILPDPVMSPMLFHSDEAVLVETIIHELAHATVFAASAGSFNEGLATFIGREGVRQFVAHFYGKRSAIVARIEQKLGDNTAYARAVGALAFDLRVLFAQRHTLSVAEMAHRKDRVFRVHQTHFREEIAPVLQTFRLRRAQLPSNNAKLSAYGIYTLQQQLYVGSFENCHESMRCLIAVLRAAASTKDPEATLRRNLQRHPIRERVLQ